MYLNTPPPALPMSLTNAVDKVPLLLQKGSIVAPSGNGLGAAQVEVYAVTQWLHQFAGLQECVGVVGTELHKTQTSTTCCTV